MATLITLLTDFGDADSYVGEVKGVLLSQVHGAALVDITHQVPPGDVRAAQYILSRVWHRFPQGSVHLAVVDPGVGTGLVGEVVEADRYGPLISILPGDEVEPGVPIKVGGTEIGTLSHTFGDVPRGALVAFVGSGGTVEIAVRDGSAARLLGGGVG